jgi:di/tricarboxylate transporter
VIIPRAAFLTPVATPQQAEAQTRSESWGWVMLVAAVLLIPLLMFILKKSRNTTTI